MPTPFLIQFSTHQYINTQKESRNSLKNICLNLESSNRKILNDFIAGTIDNDAYNIKNWN